MPTCLHDVGGGHDRVDVVPAFLYLLDVFLQAGQVGARIERLLVFGRLAQHQDTDRLACPVREATVPRMAWSAFLGSTPRRMAIPTVSSNFVGLISFMILTPAARS